LGRKRQTYNIDTTDVYTIQNRHVASHNFFGGAEGILFGGREGHKHKFGE